MLRYLMLAESAQAVHRPDLHSHATFTCAVRAFWRRIGRLFG
jgi:hypothetical protein